MAQTDQGKNSELSLLEELWRKRKDDKIGPSFCTNWHAAQALLVTSAADTGVWRNEGRRGSQFAPQAILSQLKNLTWATENKRPIALFEMLRWQEEDEFAHSQMAQTKRWENILDQFSGPQLVHIGGGHDHIYPLLAAIGQRYERVFILNIDAHRDTRTDQLAHSGTPFRQLDQLKARAKFEILQYGIHDFANSVSTATTLKTKSKVLTYDELVERTQYFRKSPATLLKKILPQQINKKMAAILSLDCDGLNSSGMEGVSAVNAQGLPLLHVQEVIALFYAHFSRAGRQLCGIYEYNPIYDSLNASGAKWIAAQVFGLLGLKK